MEMNIDNIIENLKILTISDYTKLHHKGIDYSKYTNFKCLNCGNIFKRRIKEVERHIAVENVIKEINNERI